MVLHTERLLVFWYLIRNFSGYALLGFLSIAVLAIVSVMIRNYRLTREPQQRQRIKWMIGSMAVALSVAMLFVIFGVAIMPRLDDQLKSEVGTLFFGLQHFTNLLFVGSLVAWAYAILKHRVLDINVVIRRSLRYLLASRGFILIEALLAFALLSFAFAGRLGVWLDRFGSNTRTLITILGTVLMVLALQSVNRKIRPLIDRRFFRDAYDAQQILTELTSSLRATTNVNEVLALTTAKIQQALYAANVTIFLRNGQHDFQSAVSSDYHEREKSSRTMNRDLHLPNEAFVVQRVNASSQPAEIDWDDPYSPVATQLAAMANGDAAAQQEFDTLRALKTNLVLPLAAKDDLLGVLALGPRAGDLPYSREDKRMLMNVAGQTAMALENSRLIEQKIELEAEHNRKTQELEEARRLQLSMLPKGNLRLDRLEITGAMRTATEVGGDYYDFLPLPDGRYCVVIGDATGHGMSAGLIVGMVKMGLTSRLQAQANLQPMIEDLNAALKQSLTHRGVGMCLGATIIDPVTLAVELCSNGMPYPYHFTNGSLRAIELKAQPLGFLKRVNVPIATLQMQAGEALIWVSDGFEERMNASGELWGTEQVAAALTEICQRETSGEAIARELLAACDRASDRRSNDDDMTIVVMKVLS
jgi:sigma-B regulation protein RsbU (phosphoserine phosphatase)